MTAVWLRPRLLEHPEELAPVVGRSDDERPTLQPVLLYRGHTFVAPTF